MDLVLEKEKIINLGLNSGFPIAGTRIKVMKSKRQHELFSDLERNYFYYLDFADNVIDIREQFPILPIEETIIIAQELGIEHPNNLLILGTVYFMQKN